MSETLVVRLRRANVFIRALWGGDTPPARDSACELCAEAANELERLTAEVERLVSDLNESHRNLKFVTERAEQLGCERDEARETARWLFDDYCANHVQSVVDSCFQRWSWLVETTRAPQ
jgi:hypothetical protein